MKSLLSILLLIVLASSCSKTKSSQAQMVISLGALVGVTFPGGAIVKAVNGSTGASTVYNLQDPYHVTLPFGTWSLYLVGYEGSTAWQGPHACGGIENFKFEQDVQTVKITVTAKACENEPYLTLIKSQSAGWDSALWDKSLWE